MTNVTKAKESKSSKEQLQRGKGVDIGTMFIKCAQKRDDNITFRTQRNTFFEVEHTDFTKKILDSSKVKYIIKDGKLFVVGDEALQFANMFNKETRRPLSRGVISPFEKEALPMVELLIKNVIGKPAYEGEIVYFSVPGEPLDADFNVIYHGKMIEEFLKTLGYTPKPINEAHAVILSELSEEDFTGIGLSFGGGMVNACLSFMSVPIFEFSIAKGGDWIDQQVAMAVNETASKVSAVKENSLDLGKKENLTKLESALSIYYDYLIEYLVKNMKQEFTRAKRMPEIAKPITIVLSGGTSLPKGFTGRFKQVLEQLGLPIPVGDIRMASQPIQTVAKGAVVAASADEFRN